MLSREKIYKLVEPRNKDTFASRAYNIAMLVAIAISIIPLMFREQNRLFWFFDLISGLCFIADYILRWYTADFESKRSKISAFLLYPFTPMAIIDLLSILPVFHLLVPSFRLFRVPRLFKILRVFKIIRYFEPLEIVFCVMRKQRRILLTVLSLAIFYIFVTGLIMFHAEEDIYLFRCLLLGSLYTDHGWLWRPVSHFQFRPRHQHCVLHGRHRHHRPAFGYRDSRLYGRAEKQERAKGETRSDKTASITLKTRI